MKRNILPDIGDIVFLFVLFMLVFSRPTYLFGDGSTGWHLVAGQYILQTGKIPHQDLISYTFPDKAWVAYEWLSDLIMACLVKVGGLDLLNLFLATLLATLFLLLYEDARKAGANFLMAVTLTLLGAFASANHWLARPHIFTFFTIYGFTRTLEAFRKGSLSNVKLLVILPLIMLFWANVHPGFFMGFILVSIYLSADILSYFSSAARDGATFKRIRVLALSLGLCILASFLNPYGFELYQYIFKYFRGSTVIAFTDEFQSPVFHGGIQPLSLEILFGLLVVGLAFSRKVPALAPLLASLAFAHLALMSQRGASLFVIVSLPFIAQLLAQSEHALVQLKDNYKGWLKNLINWWSTTSSSFDKTEALSSLHLVPIITVIALASTVMAGGSFVGITIPKSGFDAAHMPTATIRYIEENKLKPEQGFNYDNWGGYIKYKSGLPVFIDDRADFYGEPFYLEYAQVSLVSEKYMDVLNKRGINWVLMPKNSKLAERLKQQANWSIVSQDAAAYLFARHN